MRFALKAKGVLTPEQPQFICVCSGGSVNPASQNMGAWPADIPNHRKFMEKKAGTLFCGVPGGKRLTGGGVTARAFPAE